MGHQHPSYDHDIMNDYISTSGITTSKLYTKDNVGNYYSNSAEEPADSTFYEISLLKAKNVPAGNIIYIAVSNKRTDPLIFNKNSTTSQIQFYSTAEFDKAVTTKNSTNDLFGNPRNQDWWKGMWWKRGGCRQIKIPMTYKYKNASGVDGYALLKVSEMKGYEFYINELCSNTIMNSNTLTQTESEDLTKYLYPKVEKVIGQDGDIIADFLPGEMKIFKVQILPPGELKGKLDNINQNKMVSMPIYSSGTLTDNVVHYATYYDFDSIGIKRVYLAMSQPTHQNAVSANIAWFPPFEISDDATLYMPSTKVVNNSSSTFYDSYHPTITVRNDGDNHKVFIAYSLLHPAPTVGYDAISIMETVYDVNTLSFSASRSYNKEIAYVLTDGSDYGTPTVNSAKEVIFYAWTGLDYLTFAPSLYYTYKTPNQSGVLSPKFLRNTGGFFSDCHTNTKFLHPSLNTYSTTYTKNGNSNYATLVWEQTACSNSGTITPSNEIFMTNLFYNSTSGTYSYVLPTFNPSSSYTNMLDFYSSNKIVKFKQDKYNYVPSVYQNLLLNSSNSFINLSDYIIFESKAFLKEIKLIPIYTGSSFWDMGGGLNLRFSKDRMSSTMTRSLLNPTIK